MGNKIVINDTLSIDDEELEFKALTSSGPGGQHVNKNMTAIQLRFDINASPNLTEELRQRLVFLGGSRVTNERELVITARRHRSQARNKREAMERLVLLIQQAALKQKPRIKKRRSLAANQNRLEQKRRRSETKSLRRRIRQLFN